MELEKLLVNDKWQLCGKQLKMSSKRYFKRYMSLTNNKKKNFEKLLG